MCIEVEMPFGLRTSYSGAQDASGFSHEDWNAAKLRKCFALKAPRKRTVFASPRTGREFAGNNGAVRCVVGHAVGYYDTRMSALPGREPQNPSGYWLPQLRSFLFPFRPPPQLAPSRPAPPP